MGKVKANESTMVEREIVVQTPSSYDEGGGTQERGTMVKNSNPTVVHRRFNKG